ncbi:hypothetical protein KKA17_10230, partial [bacterium]|nr:hypothetical protein [bacterium]MBU1883440.1 hypothetical protein [bacterium]
MGLSNLRTDYVHGGYIEDRAWHIREKENMVLFTTGNNLDAHSDGTNSLAIGYGYDLVQNVNSLVDDLLFYVTSISPADTEEEALNKVVTLIKNANGVYGDSLATQINQLITLSTRKNAEDLLEEKIEKYSDALTEALGVDDLTPSRERAAIISVLYNITGPKASSIKSMIPGTIYAIRNDLRAEAWFQIRYDTNGGSSRAIVGYGIAKRRVAESDLFGLFGSDGITDDSAKAAFRMYNIHREYIIAQEWSTEGTTPIGFAYDGVNGIESQLEDSKNYLISKFGEGISFDSIDNVIVGIDTVNDNSSNRGQENINDYLAGTAKNDLIFGERGDDTLIGDKGTDVLYGGDGDDTLMGYDGYGTIDNESDILKGGNDFDTYIAGNNDIIIDSDGKGEIY